MGIATYARGVCAVPGCGRPMRARNACYRHDPGPPPRTFEYRLFSRVDAAGDCWEWTGTVDGKGYGQVHDTPTTTTGAHRAIYEFLVGQVSDDLHLDHLCRNRLCVNPDHLQPVTPAENVKRALGRRRHCKRGHLYTERTTMTDKTTGRRHCRVCWNAWHRDWRRARRAAAA